MSAAKITILAMKSCRLSLGFRLQNVAEVLLAEVLEWRRRAGGGRGVRGAGGKAGGRAVRPAHGLGAAPRAQGRAAEPRAWNT